MLSILLVPGAAKAAEDWMSHEGYLDSVEKERKTVYQQLKVVPNPFANKKADLNNQIFTQSLTDEFRSRYREKFGHTTPEQLMNSSTRYSYFNGLAWATTETNESGSFKGNYMEWYQENQRFGSYMFRRLTEYHVDKYTKDKPMVQKVYQFKEKYSRMDLQFAPKVKLKVRYEVSSNSLRLKLDNPWVDNSLLIEMDSGSLGPAEVIESTLSFNVPLTTSSNLALHYRSIEQSLSLAGSKSLGDGVSASLTTHWNKRRFVEQSLQLTEQREDIILGGLSWSY